MCPEHATETNETASARAYLIETATPGYTMTRQGPERAIGRLHPEFVRRLAAAIAEARRTGLPFAGIFSAYRPPVFGVGGFADKFHSLHTYGLAVDVSGIGAPSTPSALLWHEIAARNGVICPYGPNNLLEWNHCQPTWVKIIFADNPLHETVTADGPISLEEMFEVGHSLIAASGTVGASAGDPPAHFFKPPQARPAMATDSHMKIANNRITPKTTLSTLDAYTMRCSYRDPGCRDLAYRRLCLQRIRLPGPLRAAIAGMALDSPRFKHTRQAAGVSIQNNSGPPQGFAVALCSSFSLR
jgi:hypothetical protein